MATLNEVSEIIAHALGKQFDYTLRESIKYSILWYREKIIRDDLDRNGLSPFDFLQTYCFTLEEVDSGECNIKSGNTILRSVNKIPRPVRFKSNGRSNFMFVGTGDRSASFTFANMQELPYLSSLAFNSNTIYYTYNKERIYILNNTRLCEGLVEGVFGDPRGYENDCSKTFTDDSEIPISGDLLMSIRNGIINGDFPILSLNNNEININNDGQ